jgi:hypothetical protein
MRLSSHYRVFVKITLQKLDAFALLETSLDELLDKYFRATRKYPIPGWALAFALKSMKKPGGAMQLAMERWFKEIK